MTPQAMFNVSEEEDADRRDTLTPAGRMFRRAALPTMFFGLMMASFLAGRLYQRACWLTHGGFSNRALDDSRWHGGFGHAVSGEIARGLFG